MKTKRSGKLFKTYADCESAYLDMSNMNMLKHLAINDLVNGEVTWMTPVGDYSVGLSRYCYDEANAIAFIRFRPSSSPDQQPSTIIQHATKWIDDAIDWYVSAKASGTVSQETKDLFRLANHAREYINAYHS